MSLPASSPTQIYPPLPGGKPWSSGAPATFAAASAVKAEGWLAAEVQPFEPVLRGYLHRQFPSLDVDDIVQESYLKLLKSREVGQIASVKSYFFTVAKNIAKTLFRRRQIYSKTPVYDLPGAFVLLEEPNAAQHAETRDQLELVAIAIDRLPARCRDIIQLAFLNGLTTAEIASHLGLAEATVRVQMARGVKKCADYISERTPRL